MKSNLKLLYLYKYNNMMYKYNIITLIALMMPYINNADIISEPSWSSDEEIDLPGRWELLTAKLLYVMISGGVLAKSIYMNKNNLDEKNIDKNPDNE